VGIQPNHSEQWQKSVGWSFHSSPATYSGEEGGACNDSGLLWFVMYITGGMLAWVPAISTMTMLHMQQTHSLVTWLATYTKTRFLFYWY